MHSIMKIQYTHRYIISLNDPPSWVFCAIFGGYSWPPRLISRPAKESWPRVRGSLYDMSPQKARWNYSKRGWDQRSRRASKSSLWNVIKGSRKRVFIGLDTPLSPGAGSRLHQDESPVRPPAIERTPPAPESRLVQSAQSPGL